MTIANQGSHHPDSPGQPQATPAEDFAALALALDATRDVNQILAQVIEYAMSTMDCEGATVHLHPAGRQSATTMASDPRFAPAAPSSGVDVGQPAEVRPGLVVDLTAGSSTFGTIGFYPAHSGGFTTDDIATAKLLAVHATLAIAATRTSTHLSAAIDARTVVGQSQGIVMERYAVDADAAFALLLRFSQDNNISLQDAARSLITTRRLPSDQPAAAPRRRP